VLHRTSASKADIQQILTEKNVDSDSKIWALLNEYIDGDLQDFCTSTNSTSSSSPVSFVPGRAKKSVQDVLLRYSSMFPKAHDEDLSGYVRVLQVKQNELRSSALTMELSVCFVEQRSILLSLVNTDTPGSISAHCLLKKHKSDGTLTIEQTQGLYSAHLITCWQDTTALKGIIQLVLDKRLQSQSPSLLTPVLTVANNAVQHKITPAKVCASVHLGLQQKDVPRELFFKAMQHADCVSFLLDHSYTLPTDVLRYAIKTNKQAALLLATDHPQQPIPEDLLEELIHLQQNNLLCSLLSRRNAVDLSDDQRERSLKFAVENQSSESVKSILESRVVDSTQEAILVAIEQNSKEIVQLLMQSWRGVIPHMLQVKLEENGFNSMLKRKGNGLSSSSLIQEAKSGNTENIAQILHTQHTSLHEKTESLRLLISDGNFGVTELLPTHGAFVNTRATNGNPLFVEALLNGNREDFLCLLSFGASALMRSKSGRSPLELAVGNGMQDAVYDILHNSSAPVGLLLLQESNGSKPLIQAVQSGSYDIVSTITTALFRNKEMSIQRVLQATDSVGITALAYAVQSGSKGLAYLLASAGAPVDTRLPSGEIAIDHVVQQNETGMLRCVLRNGMLNVADRSNVPQLPGAIEDVGVEQTPDVSKDRDGVKPTYARALVHSDEAYDAVLRAVQAFLLPVPVAAVPSKYTPNTLSTMLLTLWCQSLS